MKERKIALLGMMLEANSFAPNATEADFRSRLYLEGSALWDEAMQPVSTLPQEFTSFVGTMNATGPWQPAPILLTECEPSGPVEQDFFEHTLARMLDLIAQEGPVDGVFIANHGAMTATGTTDPDGQMFEAIRKLVGPSVPIVVTLDLHANISSRMVECSDVIIGYLTNPHVDMRDRGQEAAVTMRLLLDGVRARQAFVRLPLTPASVTLLTADGPYADLIDFGQRRAREHGGGILNVSVFGGFVYSDTPENGIAVVATARDEEKLASDLANEIATRAWENRHAFNKQLRSIEAAVQIAQETVEKPNAAAVIFSDAGDNPGGGGRGNTLWLLNALVEADAKQVLYGSFFDPALAAEAHELGVGKSFDAQFNRDRESEFSEKATIPARVLALGDGKLNGRRGIYAGRAINLGSSCALEVGASKSIVVIIMSERLQTADPVFFEQFDLDISSARTVCVKSRGHFRAGFDLWFKPEQVHEIDTAGLTSPILSRFDWKGLPRPVYPLDAKTQWPQD